MYFVFTVVFFFIELNPFEFVPHYIGSLSAADSCVRVGPPPSLIYDSDSQFLVFLVVLMKFEFGFVQFLCIILSFLSCGLLE